MKPYLVDSLGISFAKHRDWVPTRSADFNRSSKGVSREGVIRWRSRFEKRRCWFCQKETNCNEFSNRRGELHHMARHDLPTCFAWLCADCHRLDGRAVTKEALPKLLYCKWKLYSRHLSWVHLALAIGYHLPEVEEHNAEL